MELHHLRYFVAVAEERHFGRAAQRLHVTQPPVSQRVKDLESELGLQLLERTTQGVRLTEAGAILLEHARNVLREVDSATLAMQRIRRGPLGELRVGMPPDTELPTLRTIIETLTDEMPDVLLRISELTTNDSLSRLRSGEIDIAVVRRPVDGVGLESSDVVVCPMGVWISRKNPLAERNSIHLSELKDSPLVIFHRSMAPAVYDQILIACRDAGFLPATVHHVRSRSFAWGLVETDLGVHFNSGSIEAPADSVVFKPLDGDPLAWHSSVMWMPRRRTDVTDAFVTAALRGLAAGGYEYTEPAS
ncbi:LysR substrate-binding domain-containing protein [Microbacterium sp.]|uniref:LysR substrate-binding domain-containing protein n=1 Tax=Microbacterium sp. TaxID=51671 RepID=UPI0039E53518